MRTEQEILDGNKLIAEFMGEKLHINTKEENEFYMGFDEIAFDIQYLKYNHSKVKGKFTERVPLRKLYYHSSWDWLMEVIQKINELDDFRYMFYIGKEFCSVKIQSQDKDLFWAGERSTIFSAWLVVIQFIEWHNRQIELKL